MQANTLKALIAEHDVSFDASTIMNALIRAGHAELVEYPSTTGSGALKSFKRLTTDGEKYGHNKSTMHPFKTESRFYSETFPEMLGEVVKQLSKEVEKL